jgi:hypothetical protein
MDAQGTLLSSQDLEVYSNSRREGNAATRRGFCTSLGRSKVLRGWKSTVVDEPLYESI